MMEGKECQQRANSSEAADSRGRRASTRLGPETETVSLKERKGRARRTRKIVQQCHDGAEDGTK